MGLVDRDTPDEGMAVIDWPVEMLDTLYVDSLKDVCAEPSSEVTGLAVRRA